MSDTQHGSRDLHVGLLGSAVQESWGGVNYVLNLVRALATLPPDDRPCLTLFVDARAPNADAFEPIRSLVMGIAPLSGPSAAGRRPIERLGRVANRFAGLWAGEVRRAARQAGCDVLFPTAISLGAHSAQRGPAWMGWAYDLQHLRMPEFFSRSDIWRRNYYFAGLARQAPRIVVSSQSARADWLRRFPATEPRVSVLSFTSVPLDEWYTASPEAVLAGHRLPRKFLLLPNQFWAHKNHSTAFEAIRLLRKRGVDVPLVCTGATHDSRHPAHFDHLRDWIAQHGLADRIHILGLLPQGEQIQLMRAAAALVQPSLFEGWSTVVEEARALGKTLYLSDLAVHREQDPPVARFFEPRDAAALADLIAREWETLESGPQPDREEAVRRAHAVRVADYARTFLKLACDTILAS